MTSIHRALFLSMAERYLLIAISLASNILLARLLTPEEIGIYSVSLAVIGIAQVLRDFGVGSFLIQEKHLTEAHIRTAFGISLLIGSILCAVIYLAAPLAESFYKERRILETMRICAVNFLTLPFCTISMALLRREMAFTRLVTVTLTATSVGFFVTISLAYAGFGPNSMAIGAVATNILTGLGAWIARKGRKLLSPSLTEWRVLLRFGSQSSAMNILTSIAMDINDLVLGKILGFTSVAIISRAQGLMNLFHRDIMSAISNVALPSFAKDHRDGVQLEPKYIASVTSVTVIAWPFYGFIGLFPIEILRLMFGNQWDSAAVLVPVFCLAGAVAATFNLIPQIITAAGRIDLITKFSVIFQPLRVALIIAVAAIYRSLLACSIAYLLAFVIHAPFLYAYKGKCIPNDFPKLSLNLLLSAKVTLGSLIFSIGIVFYFGPMRAEPIDLFVFCIAGGFTFASWLGSLLYFKHPITRDPLFKRVFGYFTDLFPR